MASNIAPEDLARILLEVAEDKKAWEPVQLDVREKTTFTDFFIICEGETDRQVRSIADAMVELAKQEKIRPMAIDGYDDATWILLDFDAVIAHIFLPGERSYYDLESLWAATAKSRSSRVL